MSYRLKLGHRAMKALKLLDKATVRRIEQKLIALAENPMDRRQAKPLEMGKGEWSSRVGNWRIIYAVDEADKMIHIFSIEPRSKSYRRY